MLPVPGRFPGEGAASQDPIEGPATVGLSLEELVARDVRPFAGVVATAPAMQLSAALYAAWDGVTPATLSPDVVRAAARAARATRGAIVSADLVAATAATGEGVGKAAVDALKAGCDLLLVPGGRAEQDAAFRAVVAAVRSGELPYARVDRGAAGAPTRSGSGQRGADPRRHRGRLVVGGVLRARPEEPAQAVLAHARDDVDVQVRDALADDVVRPR